uniref:Uncharacterized protein n=2 Tax=Rhodnius prolixus TaxID=13249 RepID=T1HNN8_RHOPR
MIILIFSTDLKNRHYIHFNSTYIWDFEDCGQESPKLIHLIRTEYMESSRMNISKQTSVADQFNRKIRPSLQLLKIFKKKKHGIFFELGANRDLDAPPSETEWLTTHLHWHGLLTQPNPDIYRGVLKFARPKTLTAQVCISPTIYVKHAFFKVGGGSANSSLIPVPCFPLYSLMRAYNTTFLDLLVLNKVNAPLQVLKTLPLSQVRVQVIGLINHGLNEVVDLGIDNDLEDLCCSEDLANILENRGYKRSFTCPIHDATDSCYYVCAKTT